jgi:endonuclease-8
MPEGPSIVILREDVSPLFVGKKIIEANGNAKIEMDILQGKKVEAFKNWGKQFLICMKGITIRVHLLMFGSYAVNEKKEFKPRLHLRFSNGELNFYNCSVKLLEGDPNDMYDWSADVMNDHWDAKKAKKKLTEHPHMLVCDALLNQDIFSGVGNIIKNEVLFRIKVHPKSSVGKLPARQLNLLVKQAREYSFDFLKWKEAFELRKHWLVNTKGICPRCDIPLHREYIGKTNRRTFFCNNCQILY